jgi:hypothetical protein
MAMLLLVTHLGKDCRGLSFATTDAIRPDP